MGLPKSWQTDLAGQRVPFGKHSVVKEAEFVTQTSLPSWLTAIGTQSQLGPDATYHGSTQFTTAASNGASAGVISSLQLQTSLYEGILFELESFKFTPTVPVASLRFDISGSGGAGAWAQQTYGEDSFVIHDGAAGVQTEIGYAVLGANPAEAHLRRNFGLLITPVTKEVYFLDSGGIVGYHDASADWVDGLVNFGFKIITASTTAVAWRASVMRLSLWWN
jgi:hypothetical protein